MNREIMEQLIRDGKLKRRSVDRHRAMSLLNAAKSGIEAVKNIKIAGGTATLVFREYYECIRQLGDARWWSMGYEPKASHEVSMDILMEIKINEGIKLQKLDRFRRIRNNANYRGYKVSIEEAEEIKDFWDSCGRDIINEIEKTISQN